MHRWGDPDDGQLPAPRLRRDLCASPAQWEKTVREGMLIVYGKQLRSLFCTISLTFFPSPFSAYLFNFLSCRRGLPYRRLFRSANLLVAFCLQVTHPKVTFNSWTKNVWSCSVAQTASLRRLLIQWVQQTCIRGLEWTLACRHREEPQRNHMTFTYGI